VLGILDMLLKVQESDGLTSNSKVDRFRDELVDELMCSVTGLL
jgi:hypothetical protein